MVTLGHRLRTTWFQSSMDDLISFEDLLRNGNSKMALRLRNLILWFLKCPSPSIHFSGNWLVDKIQLVTCIWKMYSLSRPIFCLKFGPSRKHTNRQLRGLTFLSLRHHPFHWPFQFKEPSGSRIQRCLVIYFNHALLGAKSQVSIFKRSMSSVSWQPRKSTLENA